MKVLITATNYDTLCQDGLRMLKDFGCEVELSAYDRPYTQTELMEVVGDVDACIASMEPWNEASMSAAPGLKVIARFGTGYDTVDLDAAKRHGIQVTNCPGVNAPAVAEHAAALLLALVREIPRLDRTTRAGGWERTMFHELSGRTVGIVGLGNIGKKIARIMSGFDVRLTAYNRTFRKEEAEALGVELVSLDELWSQSDYISLSIASNQDTFHMVNRESISKMKDGVLLVNAARGALVDEMAVYEALKSCRMGGFAADVLEQEPFDREHPLMKLPNFICTPHASGQTYENYKNTGLMTAKAVIDVLSGKEPDNRLV